MEKRLGKKPDPYLKSPGQVEKEKREATPTPTSSESQRRRTYGGGAYGEGRRGRSSRASY
jgi:hypothetical protein